MNACGQALLGIGRLVHPPSGTAGNGQGRASARSFQPLRFPAVLLLFPECGHTSGHGVHKDEGRGLSYTPCLLMKPGLCFWLSSPKQSPGSCRFKCHCPLMRQRHFHGNADRAYNTLHLASKVVCQWGRCPLWIPPQEKAIRYPSTGRISPFLVIQPSGCISEQSKRELWCGIFI